MKIRKASPRDTGSIIKLLEELGRPCSRNKSDKAKFARLVRMYLSDKDKTILVTQEGSTVVGMASMITIPRLNQVRQELWIADMIVSKEYQHKGIGKRFIRKCVASAKKKNCFRIRLESGNKRRSAHMFYKKAGFDQFALSFKKST